MYTRGGVVPARSSSLRDPLLVLLALREESLDRLDLFGLRVSHLSCSPRCARRSLPIIFARVAAARRRPSCARTSAAGSRVTPPTWRAARRIRAACSRLSIRWCATSSVGPTATGAVVRQQHHVVILANRPTRSGQLPRRARHRGMARAVPAPHCTPIPASASYSSSLHPPPRTPLQWVGAHAPPPRPPAWPRTPPGESGPRCSGAAFPVRQAHRQAQSRQLSATRRSPFENPAGVTRIWSAPIWTDTFPSCPATRPLLPEQRRQTSARWPDAPLLLQVGRALYPSRYGRFARPPWYN